ncbi:MAG: hypothetical protein ACYTGG_04565, partial [Planctomycetota bacterium]
MTKSKQVLVAAGMVATTTAMVAASDQPTVEDLQAQIKELRSEVAQLRSGNDENWLTEARADEIRGLVYDVLADADTRSSLLQGGAAAGYDGGF